MCTQPDFVRFLPELRSVARLLVPPWLIRKLGPQDLVQQTMEDACKCREKLPAMSDREALAYLKKALKRNLIDAFRKYGNERADLTPEVLVDSSMRLVEWIAAEQTSPSEQAMRREQFARLAEALLELPDSQRVAIEMRYLQGMRVRDIAPLLNRSADAVSLLLFRGLAALRDILNEPIT